MNIQEKDIKFESKRVTTNGGTKYKPGLEMVAYSYFKHNNEPHEVIYAIHDKGADQSKGVTEEFKKQAVIGIQEKVNEFISQKPIDKVE